MRVQLGLLFPFFFASAAFSADVFDRHTSFWLKQAPKESKAIDSLAMDVAARLKPLAANISTPCIVVKTNDGNWARALVGWGFRKGQDKPIPVLLLERFVTYRGDRGDTSSAAGDDVMLFAGFRFNFDIGQVVPEGQGGDIEFTEKGLIKPVGNAELYAVDGSLLPEEVSKKEYDPNDHDGVLPRDFEGSWTVNADGRWYGTWELKVEEGGQVQGTYTSAETKSSYPITGRVLTPPHHVRLSVELANTQQSVDAFLWTTDKSRMAGTVTLVGRKFGFYAVRESDSDESDTKASP